MMSTSKLAFRSLAKSTARHQREELLYAGHPDNDDRLHLFRSRNVRCKCRLTTANSTFCADRHRWQAELESRHSTRTTSIHESNQRPRTQRLAVNNDRNASYSNPYHLSGFSLCRLMFLIVLVTLQTTLCSMANRSPQKLIGELIITTVTTVTTSLHADSCD